MRTSIKITTVLTLVLTMGLHWAFFQVVAWTSMIITYAQKNPIQLAIHMTFDGHHPCSMCKAIQQGRADEKRQEQQQSKPGTKLDLGLVWEAPTFIFDGTQPRIPALEVQPKSGREAPPKPRPRTAAINAPA